MIPKHRSELMKTRYSVVLSLAAGAVLGAASVGGLYAQGKAPGAYVVIDISEIKDPEAFKGALGRGGSLAPFGGHNILASEKIERLHGATPPKRFVLIAFDDAGKAKAWDASAAGKEITAIREKSTTSRAFLVEATGN
jgi:uncharacterized protein (DUF1330 family)